MQELLDIRDEIYLRINVKKAALGYTNNSFNISKSWSPQETLEGLKLTYTSGKIYVIGMSSDDDNSISRGNFNRKEVIVQVAFQTYLEDDQDVPTIDSHCAFIGQLKTTCREEIAIPYYRFLRTEQLRDENGIPLSFVGLRKGIFEAYFLAIYATTVGG